MGKLPRDFAQVFHLTDLANLAGIVAHGVLCRAELSRRRIGFGDVADAGILEGRSAHGLDACVPFHFFPKNPFDGRVMKDRPGTVFVLLAVSRATARAQHWRVIPRHPLSDRETPQVLAWDAGLAAIDWIKMEPGPKRDYHDADIRRACMAEALGPSCVPLADVQSIYVHDEKVQTVVLNLLGGGTRPHVNIAPWWV